MDQVNEHATFHQDDKFERERYMEMCMKIIETHPSDRGACTIAVDAPWGVGKSTFLWMWINALNASNEALIPDMDTKEIPSKRPVLTIYYNAWESDFCDSALAPLLYSICAMFEKKRDMGWLSPKDDDFLKNFIASCASVLAIVGAKLAGADDISAQAAGVLGEVSTRGVMNLLNRSSKSGVKEPELGSIGKAYDEQLEARNAFRKALTALAQKFGGVYIFIDELDRCKPSFAIDTLDMIKHYFNIPGLTFIFGVDMLQLGHAISGRYGSNYDAEGYLSKFFEHHISLPAPTAEQMIHSCDPSIALYGDAYKRLDDIFRACWVSPREISRIVKAGNTLCTIIWKDIVHYSQNAARNFIFMLVSIKYRQTRVYNKFINGEADWNESFWNDKHSFWPYLSFFFPYILKTAEECTKEWNNILSQRNYLSNPSDELSEDMSSIGKAIIEWIHPHNTDTFGCCLSQFMEQVYI